VDTPIWTADTAGVSARTLTPTADGLILVNKHVDGLDGIARLTLVTAKVEIRPGSDADLAALVAALGQADFFTDHLARQHDGRGVLLVAWLDGRPVGDVYLSWEPADVPQVRQLLPGVPQLIHLEVVGPLQRRGTGTALIVAAEDTARRLGHEQITLAVGVDNPDARRLYERLGYVDWRQGTIVATWQERDRAGPPVIVRRPATCSSSASDRPAFGWWSLSRPRAPGRCAHAHRPELSGLGWVWSVAGQRGRAPRGRGAAAARRAAAAAGRSPAW
jgi:GNAT superfamily N-acetyltransferase